MVRRIRTRDAQKRVKLPLTCRLVQTENPYLSNGRRAGVNESVKTILPLFSVYQSSGQWPIMGLDDNFRAARLTC